MKYWNIIDYCVGLHDAYEIMRRCREKIAALEGENVQAAFKIADLAVIEVEQKIVDSENAARRNA